MWRERYQDDFAQLTSLLTEAQVNATQCRDALARLLDLIYMMDEGDAIIGANLSTVQAAKRLLAGRP
jgi:hypothetical protein